MGKKKIRFSKLLFEFISVSFAVLLALFVNQWREDRNNGRLAQLAVENIKEEINDNKEDITALIKNHKLLLSRLDSIAKPEDELIDSKGINMEVDFTLINSSSWEMAKVTNVVFYINFDDINNLAKVYNFQSYYESIVQQYVLSSFKNDKNDSDKLEETRLFLNSIIPMEENLLQYYDIMLTEVLEK